MRFNVLLLSCYFAFNVLANQEIDSLAQRFLNHESVDLKTFDLLFNLVQTRYPEELALFGEVLLEKSRIHKNNDGIHRAHDAIGTYLSVKGNQEQAFRLLFRAQRYYEKTNHQLYKMKNYYLIGWTYASLGKIDEALFWMRKSKQLAELNPDPLPLYNVRYDMAVLHFRKGEFLAGLNLIDLNKKEFDQLSLPQKAQCYTLYGNYAMSKSELDKAKMYYDSSLFYARASEDLVEMGSSMTNLGIHAFNYDVDIAKVYFDSSLVYSKESRLVSAIARDYYNLGYWYLEMDNKSMSRVYFDSSYLVAEKANAIQPMIDATQELIALSKEEGKWQEVDALNQRLLNISEKQFEVLKTSIQDYDDFESSFQEWKDQETKEEGKSRTYLLGLNASAIWIISVLILVIIALLILIVSNSMLHGDKSGN